MSIPALSVICTIGTRRERAARVAQAVAAQRPDGGLELILVDCAPQAGSPQIPDGLEGTVVARPGEWRIGSARAAGLELARAELVAFLADHCYPAPGWAQALVAAYRSGDWAAVGYAFRNANPETYGSRAAMLADFGPWLAPAPSIETPQLPPNDVSYRRETLGAFGLELPDLLTAEPLLHERLRARGDQLAVAGSALVSHGCLRTVRANALASFDYCRALAAVQVRRERWGPVRRLAQAVLSCLGAPPRRVLGAMRAPGGGWMSAETARALPAIAVQHLFAAGGQAVGYLAGPGDAERRFLSWELDAPRDLR